MRFSSPSPEAPSLPTPILLLARYIPILISAARHQKTRCGHEARLYSGSTNRSSGQTSIPVPMEKVVQNARKASAKSNGQFNRVRHDIVSQRVLRKKRFAIFQWECRTESQLYSRTHENTKAENGI